MVHVNFISPLASPFLAIYLSGFLEVQGVLSAGGNKRSQACWCERRLSQRVQKSFLASALPGI